MNAINIVQYLVPFPNQIGFWCNYIGDGDGEFIRIPELLVPDINRCINKTDHGRAESGVTPSSYRRALQEWPYTDLGWEGGRRRRRRTSSVARQNRADKNLCVFRQNRLSSIWRTRASRSYRGTARKTIPKADEPTRFSEPHENVHVHEKGEKRGRNFKRWLLISS